MTGSSVTFYPDFRRSNPYQRLLYEALPEGWFAVAGTLDTAFASLRAGTGRIFHLHWTAPLFAECSDEAAFNEEAERFLERLDLFRSEGGRVIWTIHNILPHMRRFPVAERQFRTSLGGAVDVIHLHDETALDQVRNVFPVPESKCCIAPHGHMIGAYDVPPWKRILRRAPNRKTLDLNADKPVAAVIGQLRPNKGIEDFIMGMDHAPDVSGLVAGRVAKPAEPGTFAAHCARHGVVCREGFIPVAHMAPLFGLSDMIVLPYREILTSGSLVLALSMARPVIVPDLPSFHVLKGQLFAAFYTPGDPASLGAAVNRIAQHPERHALGQSARNYIARYPWSVTAGKLFGRSE